MTRNKALLQYRDRAVSTDRPASGNREARAAASQARERKLAAERALDAVLADSFPPSDPPPWTLGVPRRRGD